MKSYEKSEKKQSFKKEQRSFSYTIHITQDRNINIEYFVHISFAGER